MERDGSAVLQDLLLSKSSIRSHIADVGRGELIATAVWYMWWERRQSTNGEKVFDPPRPAHAISALAKNFYRTKGKKSGVLRHGRKPPGAGLYKLNVDACFNIDSGTGSSGVVIRDDKGTFMAALCSDIPFADDAVSAEARGLCDGLILANELGLEKLVVESDCIEVVDTMLDSGNSLGPAAAIYEECSFLAHNFSFIQFQFCPREANMAAHILARYAEPTKTIKWFEEPPGFLVDVLANDVTLFSHEI
ncbi:hypothetical protein D1007_09808 [Hordeum vulgare]|nr:hypothetical protein D1007_09808 [Hordeum vulgare]